MSTYKQVFVDQEYDFVVNSKPAVIIDAGANIGLASVFFANRFQDAKIIAIEPAATNFQILSENVSKYANIVPIQAALWDRNEKLRLFDPAFGKWGFQTHATQGNPQAAAGQD